jgi:hypothetical protein
MFTECGNGLQYLEPSTKRKTQLTEMIFREVGQDALVYLVLAEYRLVLPEAQAAQLLWLGDALCPLADGATSKLPAAATATAAAAYNDTTAAATTAAATHDAATHSAAAPADPAPAACTAATADATTAACTLGDLVTKLRLGAFLVEDIEGRQAHVRKLFLAEDDFMIRHGLLRGQVRHRRAARCGEGATR